MRVRVSIRYIEFDHQVLSLRYTETMILEELAGISIIFLKNSSIFQFFSKPVFNLKSFEVKFGIQLDVYRITFLNEYQKNPE